MATLLAASTPESNTIQRADEHTVPEGQSLCRKQLGSGSQPIARSAVARINPRSVSDEDLDTESSVEHREDRTRREVASEKICICHDLGQQRDSIC
jgi:hypothetical protein